MLDSLTKHFGGEKGCENSELSNLSSAPSLNEIDVFLVCMHVEFQNGK